MFPLFETQPTGFELTPDICEEFEMKILAACDLVLLREERRESVDEMELVLDAIEPSQLDELINDIFESVCGTGDVITRTGSLVAMAAL